MSLMEDRPEGIHVVRWVRADAVGIDGGEKKTSFLLAPDALADWGPSSISDIDDVAVEAVLALKPEVVLLGTGLVHRMPPPRVLGAFLSRGVGVEPMDNSAAGRTFNLLAAEGRRVVAAFLL